jgi:hypothetical protein
MIIKTSLKITYRNKVVIKDGIKENGFMVTFELELLKKFLTVIAQ